jgi:NAD(P)-dependent dehydrogenase (short-subunit alcohol dehydrogenase family)
MGSRHLISRHNAPYQMSKAALESLTYNTAGEFAKDGVRVNCVVSPGLVWGPIVYGQLGQDNPQAVANLKAQRDVLPDRVGHRYDFP